MSEPSASTLLAIISLHLQVLTLCRPYPTLYLIIFFIQPHKLFIPHFNSQHSPRWLPSYKVDAVSSTGRVQALLLHTLMACWWTCRYIWTPMQVEIKRCAFFVISANWKWLITACAQLLPCDDDTRALHFMLTAAWDRRINVMLNTECLYSK